ncbi:MAG: hypothetical protein ACD_62C00208G0004 [uncultured bacterium]|nr:MAG: hypothetical protein ACD_62C00208G0004 [uncultured bacterium]
MVDPIIKTLNQKVAEKIANVKPLGGPGGTDTISKFDEVLQKKQSNAMMEKLSEAIVDKPTGGDMQVLSADNIKLQISEGEFSNVSNFDGKQAFSNIFSSINSDVVKMDSIIEVLASDNTRLSRRQLLAYQASIGTLTINTELFSKLAQSISQNLNTLLQTNLG